MGGNLITQRSKKKNVVTHSSAESKYRAMPRTSKLFWMLSILQNLGVTFTPLSVLCNNQADVVIANNPIFHERTKHIGIDYHFIRDVILDVPYILT